MEHSTYQGNSGRVRVLVVGEAAVSPEQDTDDESCVIAKALSRDHDVILALPATTTYTHDDFAVIHYNQRNLGLVARDSEVVVCGRDVFQANSFFQDSGNAATASLPRLKEGRIDADGPDADGSHFYIWVPPVARGSQPRAGLRYKWRYYRQRGGTGYALRRVLASAGRRLGLRR